MEEREKGIERERWLQKEIDGRERKGDSKRKMDIERERWRQKEREKKMLVNHFYAMNEGSSFTKTKQNNASMNQKNEERLG